MFLLRIAVSAILLFFGGSLALFVLNGIRQRKITLRQYTFSLTKRPLLYLVTIIANVIFSALFLWASIHNLYRS